MKIQNTFCFAKNLLLTYLAVESAYIQINPNSNEFFILCVVQLLMRSCTCQGERTGHNCILCFGVLEAVEEEVQVLLCRALPAFGLLGKTLWECQLRQGLSWNMLKGSLPFLISHLKGYLCPDDRKVIRLMCLSPSCRPPNSPCPVALDLH